MATDWRAAAVATCAVAWLLVASVASSAGDASRGRDAYDEGNPRVEAELLIDADAVRPGERVTVGVRFEMDPGWHIYWRNPGDSGLATHLAWRSEHAEIGPTLWPVPRVFRESDGWLKTYGYEDDLQLFTEAVVAADADGVLHVAVDADFVTCEIGCIPGRISLAREIAVSASGRAPAPSVHALFERASAALPRAPADLDVAVDVTWSQSAIRPGDAFRAALSIVSCAGHSRLACVQWSLAAEAGDDAFIPETVPGVALEVAGLAREGALPDAFSLVLSGTASPDDARVDFQAVRGLVPLGNESGDVVHVEVEVPLPRAAADAPVTHLADIIFEVGEPLVPARDAAAAPLTVSQPGAVPAPGVSLGYAVALALLGGLLLNLMPCVLPILALKVFHIADLAHERRARVLAHGAAYTAGVLASMALLATVVLLLRLAGTSVGWGFQFQEPLFVAAICTLLVVFAMNLFGAFEVTLQPQGPRAGPSVGPSSAYRSFFEGSLAVVLATPCTAPFLGTAIGFAFASSGVVIFAIFLSVGLGLAAPYALVTLVPGWAGIVPRPGAWMLVVRRGLGFSLIATVVWLLWVAGRSVGVDSQALLLAYLVGVAFLAWLHGTLQDSPRRWLSRVSVATSAVAVAFALASLPLDPLVRATTDTGASAAIASEPVDEPWRPYDVGAIERARARGRPVFVDFTADWCITCKVNESVVLASESVQAELARLNVATFKADWTLYDEEIRLVLASHGRAGVPMYLVYAPGTGGEPRVLPELLTIGLTIEALREAALGGGV